MYKCFWKRVFDLVISFLALVILWPILLIVTVCLYFVNKGAGAFFLQERPGKDGKVFKIIKYKTMTDECDSSGALLPDELRITKVGDFIRKTSIDELPQLINVLKGDMSLIGPRPLSLVYLSFYSREQARRHDVRPGITGWAQVHSRNVLVLSKKFEFDVWYVDNCSFILDLKIFFMTIKKVFLREDIGGGTDVMKDIDDLHISEKLLKYGSDYHYTSDYKKGNSIISYYPDANYYANGRQGLIDLINFYQFKRIWMPVYFCYEVIDCVKKYTDIEIRFYEDSPLCKDETEIIQQIQFMEGDVLFRMNYFGMRIWRDNSSLDVPVIEDHSHCLISDWAQNSNADWCVASLRKSLPITEGGILWSPQKKLLPPQPHQTDENIVLSSARLEAMKLKADYLIGINKDRDYLRKLYVKTEKDFDDLPISLISDDSMNILESLDIKDWYMRKSNNWSYLSKLPWPNKIKLLQPESKDCMMFSLVLFFISNNDREKVRDALIKRQCVYPAILWNIKNDNSKEIQHIGDIMLSIHCDARYDNDLEDMSKRILNAISLL